MLTFPTLKTVAAVQYPFPKTHTFGNDVVLFLGGDEQRYRTTPGPLHKWEVRLSLLDEAEMNQVETLFQAASGTNDTFSFTDPTTGTVFPSCYFSSGVLDQTFKGDLRSSVSVSIQESRA